MERVHAKSLKQFLDHLGGQNKVEVDTLYGFKLKSENGAELCYIGLEGKEGRPERYLPALRPQSAGGGSKHPQWNSVPGRLRHHYDKNGYTSLNVAVIVLQGVPKNVETGLALALEGALGRNRCIGGVLALNPSVDYVQDCCTLLRLHDAGLCVSCGQRGHLASACDTKNLLTESLPYHVQRLKVCLPTSMPPHSIGHNLATEVSNLTIELKRKRLECVSSASSGSQADLTAELRRPRLERLDVLSRSSRPQCAPKLPLLRPRTHEECHPEGPLASIESWGSMAGPRLSRELLLERLETYRVCQGFRLDVEGELGEKAIDLSRFASEEVYGSYSRQKESMRCTSCREHLVGTTKMIHI
jgi:hypothetical protein